MSVNYKKIILSTILFTICTLLVASALICMFMYFVFTKDLADFFYSMGSENIAANLYHRVYEKTDDIYFCYKSLNIEIKLEDNKNIIKYYQEFKNDDEYENFMNNLKKNNERIFVGVLEKSTLLNEVDYLENKYISALKNTNNYDQAFNLAIDNFAGYETFDFENQGVYALYQFVSSNGTDLTKFNEKYDAYNITLIEAMQDYFNDSTELFNSKTASTDLEKSYLLALGNRIITVGQNINTIYQANNNTDLINSNLVIMININDVIKGLV